MRTVYEIRHGFLGATAEIARGEPAPLGWTFSPPPDLPEGMAAKWEGGWVLVPADEAEAAKSAAEGTALAEARTAAEDRINREAEAARVAWSSPYAGQLTTYVRKLAEAQDKKIGSPGPFPYLDKEAELRGVDVDTVAAEVLATAEAWDTQINPEIEALRRSRCIQSRSAESMAALDAVFPIPWPSPSPA